MNTNQLNIRAKEPHSPILGGICCIFIIFCLFPYLRILPLDLDAQPNAMILSVLIIMAFFNRRMPKEIGMLLFVLAAAFVVMLFSNFNEMGFRVLANYISLYVVACAGYMTLRYLKGLPYNLFRYCVYVWFAFGVVQFLWDPSFGGGLTLRGEENSMLNGRGVCSLACEPTYYGMVCVFMGILNYLNFRGRKYYRQLFVLLVIQLILSKSATVFLFLILSVLVYCLIQGFRSRKGIIIIIGAFIGLLILDYVLRMYIASSDSRIANVIRTLYEDPERFLLMDYSVNNRFMHAFFPIKAFFDDWGMPHGLARFNDYIIPMSRNLEWNYLLPYDYSEEYRINSALGGVLYDLGVFALPIILILYKCLRVEHLRGYNRTLCGIIIVSMMLNNMPFSQAILPFVIGNLIYLKYRPPDDS